MKLIISGGTGYVATEVIRQSLALKSITSLIVLSRRSVTLPRSENASKVKNVIVKDYDDYPDDVKSQLSGADACIWVANLTDEEDAHLNRTVAVTPTRSMMYSAGELRRINYTCTLAGLEAMLSAGPGQPFRFVYMSGEVANEEALKTQKLLATYGKMRYETDLAVRERLRKETGQFEACIARSGIVTNTSTITGSIAAALHRMANLVPAITLPEVAAAMLQGVVHGFEAEALQCADLRRIGRAALEKGIDSQ